MFRLRYLTGILLLSSSIFFAFLGNRERVNTQVNGRIAPIIDETVASPIVVGSGKQPALHIAANGRVGLTYGLGDSVLYMASTDGGNSFSASQLVVHLPNLGLGMSRGPQITATSDYTVITANNEEGNVYAYRLDHSQGKWSSAIQLNDADTVAKEGFTAIAAFQNKVLAVWLDLRGNRKNKLYGTWSNDGGKSWGKNVLVYQSPEGTICECCKISAVADANGRFYVMFRNNLKGSRDLHLISSQDGRSFGKPQKLGQGTWVLQNCPMDGGEFSIDKSGKPVTVWRRKGEVFTVQPGQAEKLLGEGKTPSISQNSAGSFIAWQQKGDILVMTPLHPQPRKLTKGSYPQIRVLPKENAAVCAWESEGKIVLQRVEE